MAEAVLPQEATRVHKGTSGALMLGALGVVFGDIGTSPLYAFRECFTHGAAFEPTRENILGILSLIIWSLIMVICVKYMAVVLRADNKGEGGMLALMSLAQPESRSTGLGRGLPFALFLGLFGTSLLYSDGMLTPAVSVMGAIEGLVVLEPGLQTHVVWITAILLLVLFGIQRYGTGKLGNAFGPILVLWFLALAVLGVIAILGEPQVLAAVNPGYAISMGMRAPWQTFAVLGSVFLVVTGGEALYADMGHFGKSPIRRVWFLMVFPALTLNYLGQGATLLDNPDALANPFYALAPRWALVPLIVLATLAASIASQAVIAGAFSLTRQAVLLGFLPRIHVRHMSSHTIGQIYVPSVNWLLCIATLLLVVGFQSSSALAGAYGVAVTTDMLFTTMLLFIVVRARWNWSLQAAVAVCGAFLIFDLGFFGANLLKIVHGGWFPLLIALGMFVVMYTWRQGRRILSARLGEDVMTLETFVENITHGEHQPARVPGAAVFMSANPKGTPRALGHNIRHNKVIHERVIVLTISIAEEPFTNPAQRVEVVDIGRGFYRVFATYGFMESPSVPEILEAAAKKGLAITMFNTAFFLGRENIRVTKRKDMGAWRQRLFSYLARNSQSATDFYGIPANQVVELGLQVEL
jgi:KUP system potassium uptake protein